MGGTAELLDWLTQTKNAAAAIRPSRLPPPRGRLNRLAAPAGVLQADMSILEVAGRMMARCSGLPFWSSAELSQAAPPRE